MNTAAAPASNQKQDRAREAEEDRALISRAQAGDKAAFRQLVERHQRRAFAIALALVRDENDARELVQDAFLRVYKNLAGFQGGSSFFTWLYRIITNLSIDLIRKPGRQTTDLEEARLETEEGIETWSFPFLVASTVPIRRTSFAGARSPRVFSRRSTRCRATTGRSS